MKNEELSDRIVIGIPGLGPRGLGVLERLLKLAGTAPFKTLSIDLVIFEPGTPGAGVHGVNQPDFLTLNTPTVLLTQFPGDAFREPALARYGPSFIEWLWFCGYADMQLAYYSARKLFGRYCNWVFEHLRRDLPSNVHLRLVQNSVLRIEKTDGGYSLVTKSAGTFSAHYICLSTGHGTQSARVGTEENAGPYPIQPWVDVPADSVVAVNGTGLAAYDVVAALIHNCGGRFERNGDSVFYHPSGREPKIHLYSRHGIPSAARAMLAPNLRCEPCRLVPARIKAIRKEHGGPLSLDQHVWPLMLQEVRAGYYLAHLYLKEGEAAAAREWTRVVALTCAEFDKWVAEMVVVYGAFDAESFLWPTHGEHLQSAEAFHHGVRARLERDITDTRRGLANSPRKFAAEALKRARPGICEAVNFGGLDVVSWREFHQSISPMINRVAIGPELKRVEELLALVDAGIVSFALGPNPMRTVGKDGKMFLRSRHWEEPVVVADYHCAAHLPPLHLADGPDGLLASLLEPLFGTALAGARISTDYEVYDSVTGKGCGVWLQGQNCEGITYFNNYVAVTSVDGVHCPIFLEAHAVALAMLTVAKNSARSSEIVMPQF